MAKDRKDSRGKGRKVENLYIVGYARLPEGTTAKHVFGMLGLGLRLNAQSGEVLEVSCTTSPALGDDVLAEILVGRKLEQDFDNIAEDVNALYFDRTRSALLAALDDILKRFREVKGGATKK